MGTHTPNYPRRKGRRFQSDGSDSALSTAVATEEILVFLPGPSARELESGDALTYDVVCHVEDQNSTNTCRIQVFLQFGTGTAILIGDAVADDVADNDSAHLFGSIAIKTAGDAATGVITGSGNGGWNTASATSAPVKIYDASNVDTLENCSLVVTSTWSVGHADNDVRCLSARLCHEPTLNAPT